MHPNKTGVANKTVLLDHRYSVQGIDVSDSIKNEVHFQSSISNTIASLSQRYDNSIDEIEITVNHNSSSLLACFADSVWLTLKNRSQLALLITLTIKMESGETNAIHSELYQKISDLNPKTKLRTLIH